MSYDGAANEAVAEAQETLLVLGGALGDVVLRLPVLRALGPVRVLAPRSWGAMLRETGLASWGDRLDSPQYLSLWSPGGDTMPPGLVGTRRAVMTVRDEPLRAGLERRHIAVRALDPEPGPGVHQAIWFLNQLGVPTTAPGDIATPLLPVPPEWTASAEALHPGPIDALVIPGSGGSIKCWPAERFVELVQRLIARGRQPVVMLGPDELDRGWRPERFGAPTLLAPPLRETAALMARARVVVGNDAGTSHLAAAVGAPVLALFGPTDPLRWSPPGRRVRVLRWSADRSVDPGEVLSALGD